MKAHTKQTLTVFAQYVCKLKNDFDCQLSVVDILHKGESDQDYTIAEYYEMVRSAYDVLQSSQMFTTDSRFFSTLLKQRTELSKEDQLHFCAEFELLGFMLLESQRRVGLLTTHFDALSRKRRSYSYVDEDLSASQLFVIDYIEDFFWYMSRIFDNIVSFASLVEPFSKEIFENESMYFAVVSYNGHAIYIAKN